MLNSLLVNTSILTSVLYFASQLFKNQAIGSKSTLLTKAAIGALFGLAGCLLMFNGIHFSSSLLFDFRAFALMFSFIFCGSMSGGISVLIMLAFRTGYFGADINALVASVNLAVLFLFFTLISQSNLTFGRKYTLMSATHIGISLFIIQVLVPAPDLMARFSYQYVFAAILVGISLYFALIYIFNTNKLYLQLKHDSTRDSLTGLYNVRAFDKFLNQSISLEMEKNHPLSLLMLDVDFFKKINDTYGHSSGDMVLKQLSDILIASCRTHDFVSRNGGEEFTVILLGCEYACATKIAERIRKNVENTEFTIAKSKKLKITISIGVSSYPSTTASPGDLLQDADDALYFAKRSGRNAVKGPPTSCGNNVPCDPPTP